MPQKNRKIRTVFRYIAELYQKHRHFRFLIIKELTMKMGVHTRFITTTPIGKVIVTYSIRGDHILVKVDFNCLKRENLQKIFVLNEQGSTFFRRYLDSNGTELVEKEIGAWDRIEAKWASITDLNGRVGFRLRRMKNSLLRRGREALDGWLDWVGLDYEVNPKHSVFEYEIEILGVNSLR
ncbi:MAG: hypothetical protein ACE5R6_04440 [Candidatus Heimdallarchaeota archaeon]